LLGLQWDVDLYQKHSFVFKYGTSLVDILDPQIGEVILDVGCGSGQLTAEISKLGAKAIGFDADRGMVERCQSEFSDVTFFCADAADFVVADPVDAIFSNAALHWVTRAEEAVSCMARALKPGGRFVVEFGGKGNVARIVRASNHVLGRAPDENPWYFPGIAEYSELLEKNGIEVLSAHLFDRPTALEEGPSGMTAWLRMFGGILLQEVPAESKEQVIEEIVARLRDEDDSMFDGEGWTADYRRLRIVGRKLRD
jgi:SAM-dependent methyltransferase